MISEKRKKWHGGRGPSPAMSGRIGPLSPEPLLQLAPEFVFTHPSSVQPKTSLRRMHLELRHRATQKLLQLAPNTPDQRTRGVRWPKNRPVLTKGPEKTNQTGAKPRKFGGGGGVHGVSNQQNQP